jgi:glycosyltransferase involved in cell wall biosynthesis
MKILYILSQKPGNTGSGVYLKYLTREALNNNIDLRVIVGISSETDLTHLSHIPREKIFTVKFGRDITFEVAGMSDVMPYKSTKFSEFTEKMYNEYCSAFLKVFKIATNNWKPDLIHSNHLWIVTSLARNFFKNIPVITSCHGTSLRQRYLADFIEKKIIKDLKKLNIILALTEKQKETIVNWLKIDSNRVIVTGSGYAHDIFCINDNEKFLKKDLFKIIYAGKISYSKGVPYLIEAFNNINHELKKRIILYIAGDYNNIEGEKIKDNYKNVVWLGKLTQEQLAEKFKESHLFVLPSFFEGLPLVVFESLACGCAAIVTELPDISTYFDKELIDNEVIKFIPMPKLKSIDEPHEHEVENFILSLRKAIESYAASFFNNKFPDTTKFLKYISEHSFEKLFKKIFKIYMRVLN